jgi:hypothetical protein
VRRRPLRELYAQDAVGELRVNIRWFDGEWQREPTRESALISGRDGSVLETLVRLSPLTFDS